MRPRWLVSAPVFLLGVAVVVLALTLLFAHWTAQAYSFPCFLLAVVLYIYLPGRFVLTWGRLQLLPLEHVCLALIIGLITSSLVYWLTAYLGVPRLFLAWPIVATAAWAMRSGDAWSCLRTAQVAVDDQHLLLTGVLAAAGALLAVMPLYYGNIVATPEGGLRFYLLPDVGFHLSISNELTHSIPPQIPFVAGVPLVYHYAADIPAALLSDFAPLSTIDLVVRFVPTLFLGMTVLAVFTFSRAWLGSGCVAALVASLVLFGEDFAFIPGRLLHSPQCWSADCFGVPTTYCLYTFNPMQIALGLLFAALFCLQKWLKDGRRVWLLLTAVLIVAVLEYKVFVAFHLLLTLALAAPVLLLRYRDWRLVKLLCLAGGGAVLLLVPLWYSNQANARQEFHLTLPRYLPALVEFVGLAGTKWGQPVLALFGDGPVTATGLAVCLLVVLPVYLLGSLGMRVLALPGLRRALGDRTPGGALRLLLALFVLFGMTLTLACHVGNTHNSYNNSVWFYVQSKYIAWLFVAEVVVALGRWISRPLQVLAALAILVISLPSTVQFFAYFQRTPTETVPAGGVAAIRFLASHAAGGCNVIWQNEPGLPISALTRCRCPLTSVRNFTPNLASADVLARRSHDWEQFWSAWAQGEVRADTLLRYWIEYLIVDSKATRPTGSGWEQAAVLEPCLTNEAVTVYKVSIPPAVPRGPVARSLQPAQMP